jgi:arsenate reductase
MLAIYHNPRCSKSRAALELTQQFAAQNKLALDVVDYQKTPLSERQLIELHQTLQSEGAVSVRDMMRDNEDIYSELKLQDADDQTLFAAMAAHPLLLQRPIVVYNDRAVIGRPPENVAQILTTR